MPNTTETKTDFAAKRAALIAEAQATVDATNTASGCTILIPHPDGSVEELYVRKRRKWENRRPT